MSEQKPLENPVKEEPKESSSLDETVNIRVLGEDNNEIAFRIRPTTLLGKVKRGYCERMGISYEGLRFRFDGQAVRDNDTPRSLEMVDNDVIEVYSFQIGGTFF